MPGAPSSFCYLLLLQANSLEYMLDLFSPQQCQSPILDQLVVCGGVCCGEVHPNQSNSSSMFFEHANSKVCTALGPDHPTLVIALTCNGVGPPSGFLHKANQKGRFQG